MTYSLCEWGIAGIEALRSRVGALIVVDVLSFSTAVDVAVARGARILPFPSGDRSAAEAAAAAAGALLAHPRKTAGGQYSLSPASLATLPAGAELMLPSPNGSRLSLAGNGTPILAGCLRNAAAVARAAREAAGDLPIGVIPAGERWPSGDLRPAIEDWIGAGAILDALGLPLTSEARVARDAYRAVAPDLVEAITGSVSARELIDAGFPHDVDMALAVGASAAAPLLVNGAYRNAALSPGVL